MNRTQQREAATRADEAAGVAAGGAGFDFAQVVTQFETPLLRYVGHLLGGGSSEVEDVVQEAFIRLHRHVRESGADGIRHLSTWLYRVAHNMAIDAVRRKTSRRDRALGEDVVESAMDRRSGSDGDAFDLLNELARREACERAMAELRTLPEHQRTAIMLKIIEGMTMKQIGEVMDTTASNVCYHLNQGLAALARRLKKQGVI
jgi:RNA polymerase sigma-70 factor, ECF subfamily